MQTAILWDGMPCTLVNKTMFQRSLQPPSTTFEMLSARLTRHNIPENSFNIRFRVFSFLLTNHYKISKFTARILKSMKTRPNANNDVNKNFTQHRLLYFSWHSAVSLRLYSTANKRWINDHLSGRCMLTSPSTWMGVPVIGKDKKLEREYFVRPYSGIPNLNHQLYFAWDDATLT